MSLTKHIILNKLLAVKPYLQQEFQVSELALFGSYARNEQNINSDIDILIADESKSFRKYSALFHYLESLFKEHKVQIVSKSGIKKEYFERLKTDLLYV